MDRLAALVEDLMGNKPYVPDTLYLFCGRRTDRIKGLVWEGLSEYSDKKETDIFF